MSNEVNYRYVRLTMLDTGQKYHFIRELESSLSLNSSTFKSYKVIKLVIFFNLVDCNVISL